MPDCRRKASRAQRQAWRSRTATLVWLWQSRQWSRAPTPAQSLWRLQRHSVEQLRPTKPKWQRQWSGSTQEPFTQPWAHTGRHSPVTLWGGGGGQGRAAATPSPGQTRLASGSSQLLRAHPDHPPSSLVHPAPRSVPSLPRSWVQARTSCGSDDPPTPGHPIKPMHQPALPGPSAYLTPSSTPWTVFPCILLGPTPHPLLLLTGSSTPQSVWHTPLNPTRALVQPEPHLSMV